MMPAGLSISGLLTDGGVIVQSFGDLILFVVVLGFGLFVVAAIPGWIRRATGRD